jgi:hypothetical protein
MQSHALTFFMVAGACIVAVVGCSSHRAPAITPSRAISVADIRNTGVTGILGQPLGTMVTVSGIAVPNPSRRKAEAGDTVFLRIIEVDGKPLASPVEFPFRKAHETVAAPEPVVGKAFTYRGYETGGFEGVPLNYGATWQAMGFYFVDEFLVLPEK